MKKQFLLATLVTSFYPLLQASERSAILLRKAITNQQTNLALHLISEGAAEYAGPGHLQKIKILEPDKIHEFNLHPLELAVFCNQIPVVEALLKRGHSPHELIQHTETTLKDNFSCFTFITLSEMATTYDKKNALKVINNHIKQLSQQAGVYDLPSSPKRTHAQAAGEDDNVERARE